MRVDRITVGLIVCDERLAADLVPTLSTCQDLRLVTDRDVTSADVVLVLAESVTDAVVAELVALGEQGQTSARGTVLVAGPLRERHLPRLFEAGVVSILPSRGMTAGQVVRALFATSDGRAVLPDRLTRWLVDQIRFANTNLLATQGLTAGGLTVREVEVLRHIACGEDTARVAELLSYSERTIKKILQEMMARLSLRNRVHAVSYALRVGAI
ncbi:LuxR C-terminal-related transcriptional regulator [Lentzea alba]|uniref:helix-turn-helix transcriptional regulator n=1 Tax=Lentzea alba TaxID=2714351 RepID=UPI0039BFD170